MGRTTIVTFETRIRALLEPYRIPHILIRPVVDGLELHYDGSTTVGHTVNAKVLTKIIEFSGKWLKDGELYMMDNYIFIPIEGQRFTNMDDEDFELWRKLQ